MELIAEIILEIYLGLAEIIVPDHKFKKWQEVLLKLLSTLVALAILICLAAGIALLVEGQKTVGTVLTAIGGAFLGIQLIIIIIVLVHDYKKNKNNKKELANNLLFDDDVSADNKD